MTVHIPSGDRPWIVHTHLGMERFATQGEAQDRAFQLRLFFTSRPHSDIWVEGPIDPTPTESEPS